MGIEQVKAAARRLLRAAGLEVRLAKNANIEPVILRRLLDLTGAKIILDVGANLGQFGDEVFRSGYKGKVISFEAIPSVHARLLQHAKDSGRAWVIAPCVALGSRRGQIEINIAGNEVSSSILPMTRTHEAAAPQSTYVDKQLIEMTTLDHIAPSLFSSSETVMLKIDTQGYEMEVLKGATSTLRHAAALQLELSLTTLYEGAPTLAEMVFFVETQGFKLFSLVPGFWDKRSGRLLQVDGFFFREQEMIN